MNAPQQQRNNTGFTLVEILVAFAIAALFLAAFYEIFATGLRGATTAETYGKAVLLAESTLDQLAGSPLTPGDRSDHVGRYLRQSSVRERPDLGRAGVTVIPYEIDVKISWRQGVRERTVSLSTLKLGAAPETQP